MFNNNDYTRITFEQLLEDFSTRIKSDERFKNMTSASIYYMFVEMLCASMDMTNYYMQRTAEEAYIDTAMLDSSVIKLAKNLGYNPIRNVPATAEVTITLRGPLPNGLKAGAVIYFSQEDTELSFNGKKYILWNDYSYTLTNEDITNGQSNSWSKTITFSKRETDMSYFTLGDIKYYKAGNVMPIKIFQGEVVEKEFKGTNNLVKLGKNYQFYDIDDVKFSNWYSTRDPFGYENGIRYNNSSWTKVGLGKEKGAALANENLFTIEDQSIYLNKDVQKFVVSESNSPLNVCSITTNSDKSVRLKFGDGTIVTNGLNNPDETIYVQYLITDGADANTVGTVGSVVSTNNNFYASQQGSVIDVTNNIIFTLNSNIIGGANFEDQQSIKNNAPKYFSAQNRLITKNDYVSHFNGITTPLKVKNSVVWGQSELESEYNKFFKFLQNIIMYCIVGEIYKTDSEIFGIRNVLTPKGDDNLGVFSLYGEGDNYLNHLIDLVKVTKSFKSLLNEQYKQNPSEQYLKNIQYIRKNTEDKMIVNSKLISLPPIVHYFDVVGTVTVNSLKNMQDVKKRIENNIYKWLNNNTSFNTPIYKSDIIKFFNSDNDVYGTDLDIKISELIKSTPEYFTFQNIDKSKTFDISSNSTDDNRYDLITISKVDISNKELNTSMFKENSILKFKYAEKEFNCSLNNVTETSGEFTFALNYGVLKSDIDDLDNNKTLIIYINGNDFTSSSNFSKENKKLYEISDDEKFGELETILKNYLNNAEETKQTSNRAINLPYDVIVDLELDTNTSTREETIMRKGVEGNIANTLCEKSFWMSLIPNIIDKVYVNDGEIPESKWKGIENLVLDLYKKFKPTFNDSVLDDNNNITNYSLSNEIPIINLDITYKYR